MLPAKPTPDLSPGPSVRPTPVDTFPPVASGMTIPRLGIRLESGWPGPGREAAALRAECRQQLLRQERVQERRPSTLDPKGLFVAERKLSLFRLLVTTVGLLSIAAVISSNAAADRGQPVLLDSGKVSTSRWSMSVERSTGRRGNHRPCIQVAIELKVTAPPQDPLLPGSSHSEVCGSLVPIPTVQAIVNEISKPPIAVVALAFRPAVHRVRLYLGSRKDRLINLSLLSRRQAREAGVIQFRYAALAFVGDFCLNRFVTYSASGEMLDPGERMPCPR